MPSTSTRVGRYVLWLIAAFAISAPLAFSKGEADPAEPKPALPDAKPEANDDAPRKRGKRPHADPPMKDLRFKNQDEPVEERIERALSKPTEVNFIETTLEDALNYLKEYHQISIWIDRRALADAEIALDQPVSMQISGVRFESILNLLLDPFEMEWLIQDEVLKVTSREKAAAQAETRTFNVQGLLDAGHTPEELVTAIVNCVEPTTWIDQDGKGTISHTGGVLVCRQTQRVQAAVALLLSELDEQAEELLEEARHDPGALITLKAYPTPNYPADELAKALPKLIANDSWKDEHVSIIPVKGALLVRQTPHVHRELEKFLKQLVPPAEAAKVESPET